MECTGQENDSELIPTVKMETRHPVEGSFGNEFPSVCNHCRVMAAWSCKTLKKNFKFLRFFGEKWPLTGKFSKMFQKFSSQHGSTCCVQFSWNLADGKSVKSCVVHLTKENKILPGSPALGTVQIVPKCARASPQQCSQSAADFIHISSSSAELYSKARTPSKRAVKC